MIKVNKKWSIYSIKDLFRQIVVVNAGVAAWKNYTWSRLKWVRLKRASCYDEHFFLSEKNISHRLQYLKSSITTSTSYNDPVYIDLNSTI